MNITSIVDYSTTHLEIINEGTIMYVKKAYVEVQINPDDPDIIDFRWHWYEINDHQRLFYIDWRIVTTPVAASAAALLTLIEGYLTSQYGGSVADASETVKGVVEEATQAEVNAYTDTGATGAQLFIVPSKLKVWIEQAALTIDAIWHFVSAKLRLFNVAKTFYIQLETASTANRIQTFQDADGTIALTSRFTGMMNFASSTFNPADNTTYFFGGLAFTAPQTTGALRRLYFTHACTITAVILNPFVSVASSAQNTEFYIRVNNTTDTQITTTAFQLTAAGAMNVYSNLAMNIAIAAGDYIEIKMVCPLNYTTNPTGVFMQGTIGFI